MEILLDGVQALIAEPGRIAMILIGCVLMYLGIKKEYEPTLLVPMGLGTILVNIPASGVLMTGTEPGPFQILFDAGIETELFPLLLFIGIGAMIDFGPLLANPFLLLFGAAAQFGIFFVTIVATGVFGFDIADAASAGIIAAADGPTSIFVANSLGSKYMGAIMVAAYSYMALVPIIQPIAIKACTTKKERAIRMTYRPGQVSQTAKILFPVTICVVAGLIAPVSLPLVGFLMFGNLLRECGVLNSLSASAQNELVRSCTRDEHALRCAICDVAKVNHPSLPDHSDHVSHLRNRRSGASARRVACPTAQQPVRRHGRQPALSAAARASAQQAASPSVQRPERRNGRQPAPQRSGPQVGTASSPHATRRSGPTTPRRSARRGVTRCPSPAPHSLAPRAARDSRSRAQGR